MNTKQAAAAYRRISQGFFELAEAIETTASPSGAQEAVEAGREGRVMVVVADSPAPNPEPEWLPPLEDEVGPIVGRPVGVKPAAKLEDQVPEGSLTQCPKHRIDYRDGKFGKFCPAKSEDNEEGWTNDKGYCRVTPKSAVAWLRQHAGVPA